MNIAFAIDNVTKETVGHVEFYKCQDKKSELTMAKNTSSHKSIDDNLVPSEGFTEETGANGSKIFTCKQCDKTFTVEKSMKSHFSQAHKNKSKGTK